MTNEKEAVINFEKVKKENNRRFMLGATTIGKSDTGAIIYQSENKNVITVVYEGYYYHVTMEQIMNAMLDTRHPAHADKPEAGELVGMDEDKVFAFLKSLNNQTRIDARINAKIVVEGTTNPAKVYFQLSEQSTRTLAKAICDHFRQPQAVAIKWPEKLGIQDMKAFQELSDDEYDRETSRRIGYNQAIDACTLNLWVCNKEIEKSAFILANDIQTFYDLGIGSVPDIEKMIMDEFRRFGVKDSAPDE